MIKLRTFSLNDLCAAGVFATFASPVLQNYRFTNRPDLYPAPFIAYGFIFAQTPCRIAADLAAGIAGGVYRARSLARQRRPSHAGT